MALKPDSPQKILVDAVSVLLHQDKPYDAAHLVGQWVSEKSKMPATKPEAYALLNILLHWCLNNDGFEEAAQLLWGPTQFDPRPDSTRRVWSAFENHNFILLMGAGSMSKSFSMGVRLFLEWIRDPEYTTVKVLGPSEQHLEDNLFTHLVTLHRQSTIPLPGTIGKLFIGINARARKGSISGIVIPIGKKAAGRLQGTKTVPRPKPHPIFGPLTRMFVFLDEISRIPIGIFSDLDNLMSTISGNQTKIIGAFNPTDQNDLVGVRTEPPFGWQMFDPDEHFEWMSTRGWFIVRLDAKFSENVVRKEVVYPGLQTLEGFNAIIRNSGGTNTPGYWSMARGCYPPQGTILSVIPQGMLSTWKAEIIWYETPTAVGGADLALEGGDSAVLAKGLFGLATGIKTPPDMAHPLGQTIMFKNTKGKVAPRWTLLVEQLFKLPIGDTVAIKTSLLKLCQACQIRPDWLAVDRTGVGQGVFDLLRYEWGQVIGVNFYDGASETKILTEDTETAKELYDRVQSELWFGLRKFLEFGIIKAVPGLDMEALSPQLTGRLFRANGKKARVESKQDYQTRNAGKSPDEADALTLLVFAARKASGVVFGMSAENASADSSEDFDGDEMPRIDVTNRFDSGDD